MAESYEDKRYKEVMQKSVEERAATPIRKETPKKVEQAILDARGNQQAVKPAKTPKDENKTKNVKDAVRAERKPKGKQGKPFVEFNSGQVTEENLKKSNQKVFDKQQRSEREARYRDAKAEANALREKRYQDEKRSRDRDAGKWKPADNKDTGKKILGVGFALATALLIAKFVPRNGMFTIREGNLLNSQTGEVLSQIPSSTTRELDARHIAMGQSMNRTIRKSAAPPPFPPKVESEVMRQLAGAGQSQYTPTSVHAATRMVPHGRYDIWAVHIEDRDFYYALPSGTQDANQALSRFVFRGKNADRELGEFLHELQYARPYTGKSTP